MNRASFEWLIWQLQLPKTTLAKGCQQLLEPRDVLLSIKGGLGKVLMDQDLEQPMMPGQAFCVIRLRPNVPLIPAALVQYLRSAVGQFLLNKPDQGTSVSFVPIGEAIALTNLDPHPSAVQRPQGLEEDGGGLSREIEELTRRLQRLSWQGWLEDMPPALLAGDQTVGA